MKTVEMFRDYDYRPRLAPDLPQPRITIRFHAGITYTRVLEFAAQQIERAGAGRILNPQDAAGEYLTRDLVDAGRAFKPRSKRP